jgi:hypothetical protein
MERRMNIMRIRGETRIILKTKMTKRRMGNKACGGRREKMEVRRLIVKGRRMTRHRRLRTGFKINRNSWWGGGDRGIVKENGEK